MCSMCESGVSRVRAAVRRVWWWPAAVCKSQFASHSPSDPHDALHTNNTGHERPRGCGCDQGGPEGGFSQWARVKNNNTGHSVPRAPLERNKIQRPPREPPSEHTTTLTTPLRTPLVPRPAHTPVQTTQGVQSDDTTLAARCLQNVRRARCQDLVYTPPSPQLPRPKRPHSGRRAFKGASFRRATR